MGLFKRDFNKPGPGVPKNAPKKKGFSRFFEILARDFGNMVKLNLLIAGCSLPSIVCLVLCLIGFFVRMANPAQNSAFPFIGFGLLGIAFSVLNGPAYTAGYKILTKMLRDESGFVWHDFKKEFKANFKLMALPGIVISILVGSVAFAVIYYLLAVGQVNFILVAVYLFAIIIAAMSMPYFYIQASYLELSPIQLLRNSFLLALANAPRSLLGMLLNIGLVAVQVSFYAICLPIYLLIGIVIPMFLNVMMIWPKIDATFEIDKELKGRKSDELDGTIAEQEAYLEKAQLEKLRKAEELERIEIEKATK